MIGRQSIAPLLSLLSSLASVAPLAALHYLYYCINLFVGNNRPLMERAGSYRLPPLIANLAICFILLKLELVGYAQEYKRTLTLAS